MSIEINLPPEEPAEAEVAPVIVPAPDPTPVMSEADVADLARLRAEEAARIEAEAEETRRIAEEAERTAQLALDIAVNAGAEAAIAEVEAEETPQEEEHHEEEHHEEEPEEDAVPNVDSAWFKPIGRK